VQSFQRAAGSYFSALPAENATGNYVKVTQRVPVKIVFDHPEELQKYNVGPGMSVKPSVAVE
jgi:membrane fusion protein (multidrug efflux system)